MVYLMSVRSCGYGESKKRDAERGDRGSISGTNAAAENHKKKNPCKGTQFRGYLKAQPPENETGAVPARPVRSVDAVRC